MYIILCFNQVSLNIAATIEKLSNVCRGIFGKQRSIDWARSYKGSSERDVLLRPNFSPVASRTLSCQQYQMKSSHVGNLLLVQPGAQDVKRYSLSSLIVFTSGAINVSWLSAVQVITTWDVVPALCSFVTSSRSISADPQRYEGLYIGRSTERNLNSHLSCASYDSINRVSVSCELWSGALGSYTIIILEILFEF